MSRLFVPLLLQLLLHAPPSNSRTFNTVFYGTDGRTYIVSVNKRIDPDVKRKLVRLDGAAAYNEFMEIYGAYLSNPRLLAAVDGVTRNERVKKNKKNFMASLREVCNGLLLYLLSLQLCYLARLVVYCSVVLCNWETNFFNDSPPFFQNKNIS